jgi:hypothetical protein
MLTAGNDQSQYDGAVVICEWDPLALHLLQLPIKLWRHTQDPRSWLADGLHLQVPGGPNAWLIA